MRKLKKMFFPALILLFIAITEVNGSTASVLLSKENVSDDSVKSAIADKKPEIRNVFGNIFTGFYYGLKNNIEPRAAFGLTAGILGYYHDFNDKISGKIMLDVTRTTNAIEVTDSNNLPMNVSFFEGSKYTAYLKMAEIKWNINEHFALRVGQLLNTQYLTFQDKFWGYRYISVTYQELYRYGMPADFGAQLDYSIKGKLTNSLSVVNGEGPFRHQDNNSKLLVANDLLLHPTPALSIKLYVDYQPPSDTGSDLKARSVISGFMGYKREDFRIGFEYNHILNPNFEEEPDYSGISFYSTYVLNKKFELLGRFDYINRALNIEYGKYVIVGFQYKAWDILNTSLNYRLFMPGEIHQIYVNFGLKF